MSIDIGAALDATPSVKAGDRCKIQRWLDTIPEDADRKPELVAAFTTSDDRSPAYKTYDQLLAIAARLGCRTSDKTIMAHRNGSCRCSW